MNPFDLFDKIYCVSLDSRPDRWLLAEREFEKAHILDRVERFSAIEMPENPGRGNHLSHAQCIRKAKEAGAKNVLIFEDDIEWLEDPLLLKRAIPELDNWDLLYLGANTERSATQISRHLARLSFAYATHAYAINQILFDPLIKLNEDPATIHNDVRMCEEIVPKYNCLATIPLLAGQRDGYSDIQRKEMSSNQMFRDRYYGNMIWKSFPADEPTFVTFVIPTMGRASLSRAVDSVINQTDWNWQCVVMFDGREINYSTGNDHVRVYQCEHKGHAGLVRNEGMKKVATDWIAFLDDDDWVDSDYVVSLRKYANDYDVVIFTYKDVKTGNTQPPPGSGEDFHSCNVGISFAVRTDFLIKNGIEFDKFAVEDFRFLDWCRKCGARYKVTHEIKYRVGGISGWTG